jgi:hypothetical protein
VAAMADDNRITKLRSNPAKLIDRAVEIQERNVLDRNELGFSTRVFVQCSLPHRDPAKKGNPNVWKRVNGNFSLRIQPGWDEKDGKAFCIGYAYGNIPRLLLFYVCTQAIQTKQRKIALGTSLSEFMRAVDLEVTGGKQGTIARFKEQVWRLFNASISFNYESDNVKAVTKANIANTIQLWWNPEYPDQGSLFENYIILTEEFYNEIMTYPVPVDMGIVSAIKQSPLALDLYTWLTYRVVSLNKPTRISWASLSGQVGSDYSDLDNFVRNTKEALAKIYSCWPELQIDEVQGGVILKPSRTSVPLKIFSQLPSKK